MQPAIDRARLKDIFGDDETSIASTLKLASGVFSALNIALNEASSPEAAIASAHELKGAAVNVGAMQLHELSQEIESRLQSGDSLEAVRPLFGHVSAAVDCFKRQI